MKKKIAVLLALILVGLTLPTMAEQTTFALKKENNKVFVGETVQMALNRTGEAAEGEVTYASSNQKCATVDENGVVTGLSKGQTTITARLQKDKRVYKSSLTVTIVVKAEEISVTEDDLPLFDAEDPLIAPLLAPTEDTEQQEEKLPVLLLRMGSQQTLKATVLPANANDRAVVLSTTDEAIVRAKGNTLTPKAVPPAGVAARDQNADHRAAEDHHDRRNAAPDRCVFAGECLHQGCDLVKRQREGRHGG